MFTLHLGDCLEILPKLPADSVQAVVTSPPYYSLRDYGVEGQIGLESTPEAYVEKLVNVFREVRRVLRDDGVLWLNLGDTYAGGKGQNARNDHTLEQRKAEGRTIQRRETTISTLKTLPADNAAMLRERRMKPKDLIGIPWMVAFALRDDGWYLRQDIIWAKPNPMPESVTDRCTKSHEYIFLLTKNRDYYYDFEAILEPANYDGRKATEMQGSKKYHNGFAPTNENPNTLHIEGHERWSRKIGRTERKCHEQNIHKDYSNGKNGNGEYVGHKMAGTNYGGDGKGLHGHSGYYDKDGNPRFNQFEDGTPARNKRSVWYVSTKPYKEAHFATYPAELIEPCILAGSRVGDTILDPFNGSGTTGEVAIKYGRHYIGIEINPEYIKLAERRLLAIPVPLFEQGLPPAPPPV